MTYVDQSLCILDGISPASEISLRNRGYLTTRQLLAHADELFSSKHARSLRSDYELISKARQLNRLDVLVNHFPCGYRVRVLHDFFDEALFYDIETDGCAASSNITCISVYVNGTLMSFVRDKNLNDFVDCFHRAKLLVSFNGKRFDTPTVCRTFRLSTIPAQIDLMDESRHFGFRGGLKAIERQMGFERIHSEGVSGLDAISLWDEYMKEQDEDALEKLIAYNQEDVLSLVFLYKTILKLSTENVSFDL